MPEIPDAHGNPVDLLMGLRRMDPGIGARVVEAEWEGTRVRFVGREDLVAVKVFAGSGQDLEDVRRLIEVSKETLDRDLVLELAGRFGKRCRGSVERLLGG